MLRNMMASSAIYWFVVALIGVANSQYLDANKCVAGKASLNATSGVCECNPGLVGVGDLCCSETNDKDVCYMSGDPILTSVKGQKVPINIPCSICIAVVESQSKFGQECVLEVLAASTVADDGAIYNSIIKVGVSVNKARPVYYAFTGNAVDITEPQKSANTLKGDNFIGPGLEIGHVRVKYDPDAQIWSLEGCQTIVSFRPHIPGLKLSPGACIQASKESIVKSVENGNICGLPASYDKSVPWAYGVLNDALSTRQIFGVPQSLSHPDYTDICSDDIDEVMGQTCVGISKDAMAQCGPILYNPAVRVCLAAMGSGGAELLRLFGFCLETYCSGSQESCEDFASSEAIETCLPSFTECNNWPYYIEDNQF